MRRFATVLVFAAIIAIVFGAFSRLIAQTRTPDVRGVIASLTHAGGWLTSHALPLGKAQVPDVGGLFGRFQTPAQSQKGGGKSTATVQTDRAEYPPDAQVNVTGSGWLPGEAVVLTLTETATTPPGGFTDGPFVFYTTADDQGQIANGDFYTDRHDLGVTFLLTAKGILSGLTAQTTFTDAFTYATFFQLDGNTATAATTPVSHDWDQVHADVTSPNSHVSGTAAINFYNDPVPVAVPDVLPQTEDTYSGGNSKDINDISAWTYNSSPPQNKANLENAIAAAYVDPNNSNHTYLYVGADRYDNSGSMALGVWFLQSPVGQSGGKFYTLNANGTPNISSPAHHVDGDLLLVANFASGTATITSFKWSAATGTIPSTGTTLSNTIGTAVVNAAALDGAGTHAPAVPWPYKSSANGAAASFVQTGEFFEAGVDLNLLFPGQTNFNFSSFIVETRSSTSPTATLSDLIVGHVSTAPDVAVTKVADSTSVDAGSQVGFTVTVSNVGVGDLANVALTDALPPGTGNDIVWSIPAGGNPSGKFVLNGTTAGSQSLSLVPSLALAYNSAPIAVHIVGTSTSVDLGPLTNTATVAASNEDLAFSGNNQASATVTLVGSGVSTITPQDAVEGASHTFQMGTFTSAGSGTANVVVNWGDGTTNTTFSFTNTPNVGYAMPSQTHTYVEEGTYTVTETVTLGVSVKSGTFVVNVSDPAVIAAGVSTITKPYDGLIVGTRNLATFTDPGGAEPLGTDYSATINWGGSFGTSTGTISYSGAVGSTTGVFTVSASVPYKDVATYSPEVTINHELTTAQVVTDTVTITRTPLSITADANTGTAPVDAFTKVYDGLVFSPFTVRYSGFVNGETSAVLGGTLAFSGAATTAVNVGTGYVVTPGGQTSDNYNITYVNGSLNITKAALSITADANTGTAAVEAFTKVYNGLVFSPFTVRYSGFVNDETSAVLGGTLGFSGAGTTAVNVGTGYVVTPGGQTSDNYLITFVPGSLNITKGSLIVTADNDSFNEGVDPTGELTATISGVNGETPASCGVTGSPAVTTTANGMSAPATYPITAANGTLAAINCDFAFYPGTLTVVDVAPTIVMSTGTINLSPGDGFTRPGSFSDPGTAVLPTETWTITTDYGDGSPVGAPTTTTPGSISVGHVYPSAGTFTVTVTIADNYGASSVLIFAVNVATPPTLTVDHGSTAQRNVLFGITGHFTEGTATGSYIINWGDPAGASGSNPNVQTGAVTSGSGEFIGAHSYKHKGTYNVAVTFTDANGDNITVQFDVPVS